MLSCVLYCLVISIGIIINWSEMVSCNQSGFRLSCITYYFMAMGFWIVETQLWGRFGTPQVFYSRRSGFFHVGSILPKSPQVFSFTSVGQFPKFFSDLLLYLGAGSPSPVTASSVETHARFQLGRRGCKLSSSLSMEAHADAS